MSLLPEDLQHVDNHWAVLAVGAEARDQCLQLADEFLIQKDLQGIISHSLQLSADDCKLLERLATAYEIASHEGIEALLHPVSSQNQRLHSQAQAAAYRAFGIRRVLPIQDGSDEERIFHILHLAGLAYCGDRWTDLRRWIGDSPLANKIPSVADARWDQRLLYRIYDAWIRLLRKSDWSNLEQIAGLILTLREEQKEYEKGFLDSAASGYGKSIALRLVSLYHWAKATERLSLYMLQGEPASINSELDLHFEAAYSAAKGSQDYQLEMILRWLHVASRKMAAGSVWWVAHTVNSRVTKFVDLVTKSKGIFELLPPQRIALQEQGLLDQANRAVVIDMPTSGGKTALAQFRILQALNQFSQDGGWVAYIAPTRALVSQITRRLKEDFSPLGIGVEQLTGAIEIDAFESEILTASAGFQILVSTPEKFQLVIRNRKIERPLALVVMDEAHNLEDTERGLRVELLLATIKQEKPKANFLLLMPFVPNAKDLAQWLGGDAGKTISLSTSPWQPNERIVGLFNIGRPSGDGVKKGDWVLNFETLTTTQGSIRLHGSHQVDGIRPLKRLSYTDANKLTVQAGAMAKAFSVKGTSIVVAQKIPDVWSVARTLSAELDVLRVVPDEISLVQRFLRTEIGAQFELVDMLSRGIGVHHAGLPSEVLSLIEWLTELGHIRILCATTTIAQGLNFPVSSVFLASRKYPYGIEMSHRSFWNLAGRAGRVQHGSAGVVGIAAGSNPNEVREYVSKATGSLVSRMISMLNELDAAGNLLDLSRVIYQDQWTDFRSYVAHLWNEKRNLDVVIAEAEQLLRNTYGYSSLRGMGDQGSRNKADAVLEATKHYVRDLAEHPENATLADSTGFSPEGVRTALLELQQLENQISSQDWEPASLFGSGGSSVLPTLVGIMMKVPQLQEGLNKIKGSGPDKSRISDITQAWVGGKSIEEIALQYFEGKTETDQISNACKALYRDLANNGAWGLSALSKMPTSGLNFDELTNEERRRINNIPAMLYHGVRSEEAVLMRMSNVPRTVAEPLAEVFRGIQDKDLSSSAANKFLRELDTSAWDRVRPKDAAMSGADYQKVWKHLSGEI